MAARTTGKPFVRKSAAAASRRSPRAAAAPRACGQPKPCGRVDRALAPPRLSVIRARAGPLPLSPFPLSHPPPSLPYKVNTSRPSLRTNWTRLPQVAGQAPGGEAAAPGALLPALVLDSRHCYVRLLPPRTEGVYSRDMGRGNSREGGVSLPSHSPRCVLVPHAQPLYTPSSQTKLTNPTTRPTPLTLRRCRPGACLHVLPRGGPHADAAGRVRVAGPLGERAGRLPDP